MRKIIAALLLIIQVSCSYSQEALPVYDNAKEKRTGIDWLVAPVKEQAAVYRTNNGKDIVLYNGLLKRVFRLEPNIACIDYKNLSNGQQLLRAVKAEARLTIDGRAYNVGGLHGQQENAYLLPEWIDSFRDSSSDFHFIKYTTGSIQPWLNWKPASKSFQRVPPAGGAELCFIYVFPGSTERAAGYHSL
jgi:hypothetical protein